MVLFDLFTWIGVFAISLFVLVKSSDYFTEAAEKLGIFFKIPPFLTGVTIVALGTSMPELASSVLAVWEGISEVVAGNIVGSNIANILLVLGIAAVVSKTDLDVKWELIHVDLPIFVASAFILVLSIMDGSLVLWESVLLILAYLVYASYSISKGKEHRLREEITATKRELKRRLREEEEIKKKRLSWKTPITFLISIVFIVLSAHFTIVSLQNMSEIMVIGAEIIAASALALGTSLPEVVVAYNFARKDQGEMAVGTVLGSNIINTFLIMGVAGFIGTLVITQTIIWLGLPFLIGSTILYFFVTEDKEVTKWEGWMLIILYALFIYQLINSIGLTLF